MFFKYRVHVLINLWCAERLCYHVIWCLSLILYTRCPEGHSVEFPGTIVQDIKCKPDPSTSVAIRPSGSTSPPSTPPDKGKKYKKKRRGGEISPQLSADCIASLKITTNIDLFNAQKSRKSLIPWELTIIIKDNLYSFVIIIYTFNIECYQCDKYFKGLRTYCRNPVVYILCA